MARILPESAWVKMRDLFCGGLSIRKIAARCGVSAGTIGSRSVKENWVSQRRQLAITGGDAISPDVEDQLILEIVRQNKRATLKNESRTAMLLSEQALRRAEAGLKIESIDDVMSAQEYRSRLWPAAPTDPTMRIDIGAPGIGEPGSVALVLKYDHERPKP